MKRRSPDDNASPDALLIVNEMFDSFRSIERDTTEDREFPNVTDALFYVGDQLKRIADAMMQRKEEA